MKLTFLVLILLITSAHIAGAESSQHTPTKKEIKAVDSFIKKQERIRSREYVSLNRTEYREARRYLLGDINGDKIPDLVVCYTLEEGNTYNQFMAVLIGPSMSRGVSTRVGGKGFRGVELKRIAEGIIEFNVNYYSTNDPLCCPSIPGTSAYYLSEGVLIEGEVRINCAEIKPPE